MILPKSKFSLWASVLIVLLCINIFFGYQIKVNTLGMFWINCLLGTFLFKNNMIIYSFLFGFISLGLLYIYSDMIFIAFLGGVSCIALFSVMCYCMVIDLYYFNRKRFTPETNIDDVSYVLYHVTKNNFIGIPNNWRIIICDEVNCMLVNENNNIMYCVNIDYHLRKKNKSWSYITPGNYTEFLDTFNEKIFNNKYTSFYGSVFDLTDRDIIIDIDESEYTITNNGLILLNNNGENYIKNIYTLLWETSKLINHIQKYEENKARFGYSEPKQLEFSKMYVHHIDYLEFKNIPYLQQIRNKFNSLLGISNIIKCYQIIKEDHEYIETHRKEYKKIKKKIKNMMKKKCYRYCDVVNFIKDYNFIESYKEKYENVVETMCQCFEDYIRNNADNKCIICLDNKKHMLNLSCGDGKQFDHMYCISCFCEWYKNHDKECCQCKQEINFDNISVVL
jgi:hypothetical protein